MEAEDPLNNLADIHLPDPVSLWPPAPGWWVLAVLLLAALVYAGFRYAAYWRRQRRLKSALRELDRAYSAYQKAAAGNSNAAGLAYLQDCNNVLKRVALLHHPAAKVARLHGRDWLAFLDAEGETEEFTSGAGRILADGGYRPTFEGDVPAIQSLCASWIRHVYARAETPRKPQKPERKTRARRGAQRIEA